MVAWAERPADWDKPGHIDRADEKEAILDRIESIPEFLSAYKPADETGSASSTTFQDDDDLFVTVQANAVYAYTLHTTLTAGATPQMKVRLSLPSGASLAAAGYHAGNTYGTPTNPTTESLVVGLQGTALPYDLHGTLFVGATAGTFKVQWAQTTSNAATITMHKGSRLTLTRLA